MDGANFEMVISFHDRLVRSSDPYFVKIRSKCLEETSPCPSFPVTVNIQSLANQTN